MFLLVHLLAGTISEDQQIRLQYLVDVRLAERVGRTESVRGVGARQRNHRLLNHELLDGGDGADEVAHRQPLTGPPDAVQRCRDRGSPVPQDADAIRLAHRRGVRGQRWGLEAADDPAMLLGEVAAHDGGEDVLRRDLALRILRQGLVGWPDALLHAQHATRGAPGEHLLQGRLQERRLPSHQRAAHADGANAANRAKRE
mmetsp:Transcript_44306/g.128109  ORF Transcript_44306/g.128109 Transcript_44306/m.128109 type:complete len:200 (+) Transcript_44306:814-1413(+)